MFPTEKRIKVRSFKTTLYLLDLGFKPHHFHCTVSVVEVDTIYKLAVWECEGLQGRVRYDGPGGDKHLMKLVARDAQHLFRVECVEWRNSVGECE